MGGEDMDAANAYDLGALDVLMAAGKAKEDGGAFRNGVRHDPDPDGRGLCNEPLQVTLNTSTQRGRTKPASFLC